MKIVLLRHGESVDDILDCYGGAADYELSESGIKTAHEVAKSLSIMTIERIYSSPLKRAYQTAEVINDQLECGISVIEQLRERNSYGVLSGCNKDECKVIFGYIIDGLKNKPGDYYSEELVTGAEEKNLFDIRVKESLLEVVRDAQRNNLGLVAVVTHGNVTRSIYKNILGVENKISLDLLAKSLIEYENGQFSLESNEGIHEK